ncbi:MAG TPA: S4 domain-containing protein YaaA [Clostridium sp.]|uniref:S4 domain-containing protein YaaA n=1 Tax=unclassified Clostridium TaxID=2614128 RepID=UPI000EEFCA24|nr:S4 domain-containing protein YaaA [Clostridium sp.]
MVEIKIDTEFIKLDSFLKFTGAATLGSEAKFYIQNGDVKVNGEVEIRRGRKLYQSDRIKFQEEEYIIV